MNNNTSQPNKLIESLSKEPRYCVLECSVFLEERVSETLGRILELDWKKTESLGYGTSSLGFNNKILLIKDLKEVLKIEKTKFESFMTIRNKFAHISEINSFEAYFRQIKSGKERKKEFKAWFPNLEFESKDIEGVYKFAYFLLTLELNKILAYIEVKHEYLKGRKDGRLEILEKFMTEIKSRLQETDEGKGILKKTFDQILNKNGG